MRYRQPLTVPIAVDRSRRAPLPDQIAEQIRTAVEAGRLPHGARVPSTRSLAEALGVSRGVVADAYDGLWRTGHLDGRRGSGTYVSAGGPAGAAAHRPAPPPSDVVDLRPGRPPAGLFPLAAWRAAWRWASHRPPPAAPLPRAGRADLREALATHLGGYGVSLAGRTVVATTGVRAGMRLAHALGLPSRVLHPAEEPPLPDIGDAVLVGAFDELLTGHLPVGYAVLPADNAVAPRAADRPGYLPQRVAFRLLADGVIARMAPRCRDLYARRAIEVDTATEGLPRLAGRLRCGPLGTAALATGSTAAGLRAMGVLTGPHEAGVLIGYAHLAPPDLRRALERLDAALARTAGGLIPRRPSA